MEHKGTKVIETAGLLLRPFVLDDVMSAYCNWCSDARVTEFLTWQPHKDPKETLNMVATWVESYKNLDFYQWAIVPKDLGVAVGSISVVEHKEQVESVHIGYCIGTAWWGKGITTEAFAGILPFLFEEVGVKRVDSRHDPQNIGSGKVMEKCGLRYEGTLRQWDWNNRGRVDSAYYGLLAEDYQKSGGGEVKFRVWREEDLPSLKEIWKKAFFDEDSYIENFFAQFTGLVYVAEELGRVIGMAFLFDSMLHRNGACHKMGYVYALGTHPDYRGRGVASGLLAYLHGDVRERGYEAVTTVPANPSLHDFFGTAGYLEYFQYSELGYGGDFSKMEPISMEEYVIRREEMLDLEAGGLPYISLQEAGYGYQASISALGKGGLFWDGRVLMAVEQSADDVVIIKECLSLDKVAEEFLGCQVGQGRGLPGKSEENIDFGMVQWLVSPPTDWTEEERGYLGFAFD